MPSNNVLLLDQFSWLLVTTTIQFISRQCVVVKLLIMTDDPFSFAPTWRSACKAPPAARQRAMYRSSPVAMTVYTFYFNIYKLGCTFQKDICLSELSELLNLAPYFPLFELIIILIFQFGIDIGFWCCKGRTPIDQSIDRKIMLDRLVYLDPPFVQPNKMASYPCLPRNVHTLTLYFGG